MAQITCRNLSFAYDGETVLSDIEFSLDAGAYLCIVGENGSGKSTLMRGILGLKQPSKGEIVFDDLKPTEIGYLPQQTQIQRDFPASVREVVLSGRLNSMRGRLFYNAEDKAAAAENMETMVGSTVCVIKANARSIIGCTVCVEKETSCPTTPMTDWMICTTPSKAARPPSCPPKMVDSNPPLPSAPENISRSGAIAFATPPSWNSPEMN